MKMTHRKNFLAHALASALACAAHSLAAQDAVITTQPLEAPERPLYRRFTIGLEAGSTGAGASVAWRFSDHFGARGGFDYFEYSDSGLVIKSLKYDANVRLMSEPLTFDIYPWVKHSFHLSVGIMFNQNRLTGTAVDGGTINPPDNLGTLSLKIDQQLVNPYLSIGGNFFYFDRGHHVALGGELGVVYTGNPNVSLSSSRSGPGIDRGLRIGESQIQDYANQFKWWPIAKLYLTYSF
jgi:hypothetical protein